MSLKLVKEYDSTYYPHRATGKLWFDPKKGTKHFDANWLLFRTDQGILDFYGWLAGTRGIHINTRGLWGPHISVIKGEELKINRPLWGFHNHKPIYFWYSNIIRFDNDKHAWLDVWSKDLFEIRQLFGLRDKNMFHLTLGLLA